MREIHRILFVRTDRIGDVLMNLPAIQLLRQSYPKAWIALLTTESVAGLLKGHDDLDEIIVSDSANDKSIRKASFDMVVISNPNKRDHIRFFLMGIRVRVGYQRKWGFLLTHRLPVNPNRATRHEFENNLDLVRLISKGNWSGHVVLPFLKPKKSLPEGPMLAVHAGTSNPKKRWALEHFAELIRQVIRRKGWKVVLIGGPEEAEESARLISMVGEPLENWVGNTTLKEVAGLFNAKQVRCLVSSDSGPVHIAWMSGTPVVAFYAKEDSGSDPRRWGPRDLYSICIHKKMSEISVEEVYRAVEQMPERA